MQEKPFYVHIELHKKIVKNAWIISYEERKILAWAAGVIFQQSCFMSVLQDHLLQRLLYTLDHFGGMRI